MPHIIENSPQGSDQSDDSSDSEDAAHVAHALAEAAECTAEQRAACAADDAAATSALLKAQKREAIRKAVEAQRAELEGGRER
jgi:hypothetical protein